MRNHSKNNTIKTKITINLKTPILFTKIAIHFQDILVKETYCETGMMFEREQM